jgi:hypothetical protein
VNPLQILTILSTVAAGVWSVLTWREEQEKERRIKRDREAALYVNSLILATEELQSVLYKILAEDELAYYKKQYPDQHVFGSPGAIELLYRVAQFFAWAHRTWRFGPYTRDPTVIALVREAGKAWESRAFPGDAFCFSLAERLALGDAVVRHIGETSDALPMFEAIPLYEFEKEIRDERGERAPLYRSRAVHLTLSALDRADKPEALEGHERLAVLQNLLVDLLVYLERKEGFCFSGEKKVVLAGSYAMTEEQVTPLRTIHQTRGRIRLGVPRVKTDRAYAHRLQSLLESMENVTCVRVSPDTASVIISYSPHIPEAEFAGAVAKTIEGGSNRGQSGNAE